MERKREKDKAQQTSAKMARKRRIKHMIRVKKK
jgi:hypothetical protein